MDKACFDALDQSAQLSVIYELLNTLTVDNTLSLQDLIDAIAAIDTAGIVSAIQAVEADLANLERKIASASILSITTANPGTGWTTFASTPCNALELVNDTGVSLDVRRGGAGNEFIMPTGTSKIFAGITNADQIGVKRTDDSNSTVTAYAEALVYA